MDRDLSDLIPQKLPSDTNIYVTDKYSIENSIVNRNTCKRMLTEKFGFSDESHEEMDQVCDQFERELEAFLVAMIPTMAWILFWRRRGAKANLNNIKIGKLMSVRNGAVVVDKTKDERKQYVHKSAGIFYDPLVDVSAEEAEFSKASVYRSFVRGKYVLWFLVMFCKSVYSDAESYFSRCTKPPKMHVSISPKNAVTIMGNLARVPPSPSNFSKEDFLCLCREKGSLTMPASGEHKTVQPMSRIKRALFPTFVTHTIQF